MMRAALASVNRPAETVIHRDVVMCGSRQVHYRRAGSGPPAIMWNQSPHISPAVERLFHRLASHFTVFAIDLPGFGLSYPLPAETLEIRHFAEALAETLDALAVEKAVFVGRQIGWPIIVDFALRYPDRVAAAALDGAPVVGESIAEDCADRPAHVGTPAWDGSHLVGAWASLRDAQMFSPWSTRTVSTRRIADMPSARAIHDEHFMELMRSSATAQQAFTVALDYDAAGAIGRLTVPTTIFCGDNDPFSARIDQAPSLPENVRLERVRSDERDAAIESITEFLVSFTGARSYEQLAAGEAASAAQGDCFVRIRSGSVHLQARIAGGGEGRPLVLLHGAGESSLVFGGLQARLAQSRRVIAFDLPGHGDSDRILEGYIPRFLAAALAEALDCFELAEVDLLGRGLGAAIAVELALAEPQRIARIAIVEQPLLSAEERSEFVGAYAPPIEPVWDGTHLVSLWNQIRDREFFWPWFRQKKGAIREIEPNVDAVAVHARVLDALCCGSGYAHAHRNWFDWPAQPRLERVQQPLLVIARRGDGWSRDAETIASSMKRGSVSWVQGDVGELGAALETFLAA